MSKKKEFLAREFGLQITDATKKFLSDNGLGHLYI